MSIKQAIEALEAADRTFAENGLLAIHAARQELVAALAALRSMPAEPVAWMVPEIMSFKGVKSTSCPKEAQDAIEGTVGWSPSMIGDMPPVTDKHGVTHSPKPLYEASCPTQVSDLEHRVAELEAEVLQQTRINGMGAERELALASRVMELERERDALRVAIDDAAYHYSQYIVEDTAHCTLTEHMLSAFDAALSASKEAA